MATITLTNLDLLDASEICTIHDGWPTHALAECDLLAGIRFFSLDWRCSICDLAWDAEHRTGAPCRLMRGETLVETGHRILECSNHSGEAVRVEYSPLP